MMPKFKSEAIGFRVGNKQKQKIDEVAAEHEMSTAEFIRYITLKYIEDYEKRKESKQQLV